MTDKDDDYEINVQCLAAMELAPQLMQYIRDTYKPDTEPVVMLVTLILVLRMFLDAVDPQSARDHDAQVCAHLLQLPGPWDAVYRIPDTKI